MKNEYVSMYIYWFLYLPCFALFALQAIVKLCVISVLILMEPNFLVVAMTGGLSYGTLRQVSVRIITEKAKSFAQYYFKDMLPFFFSKKNAFLFMEML